MKKEAIKKQTHTPENLIFSGCHSIEIEKTVLGIVLSFNDKISEVYGVLKSEYFYNNDNRLIYNELVKLYNEGNPDLITLINILPDKAVIIAECTQNVYTDQTLQNYILILKDLFIKRSLQVLGFTLNEMILNKDSSENILNFIDSQILNLSTIGINDNTINLNDVLKLVTNQIKNIIDTGQLIGINTGYENLNKYLLGWQNSDLIILAGRPSMGKTALALNFALNIAEKNPVLFFSMEMSAGALGYRFLSNETSATPMQLKQGYKLNFNDILEGANRLQRKNILLNEYARTPEQIRQNIKKQIKKNNIKFVIIDYMQLMNGEGQNREQEISGISRKLKGIAKELSVPIMVLSQLSRQVESRADKIPMLSDLRESGSIEQDADLILFPFRPIYYGFETDEFNNSTTNLMRLIIAKNRNGATGIINLFCNDSLTKITEYENNNLAF